MQQLIRSKGLNFGVILGALLSLITVLAYAFKLELFTSLWLLLFNVLAIIVIGIMSIASAKKANNGLISFKHAFGLFLLTVIIGLIISLITAGIIFNVVDPGVKDTIKELQIESTTEMMERFNAPTETIDEAIDKMRNDDPFSFMSQIKSLAIMTIFYAILGLIVAAAMKKSDTNNY